MVIGNLLEHIKQKWQSSTDKIQGRIRFQEVNKKLSELVLAKIRQNKRNISNVKPKKRINK